MTDMTAAWGQDQADLPALTKKDTLKRYRMRVEGVKAWRQDEGFDKLWQRMRDIYRLRMFSAFSNEDRVLVAISFATINVMEPSVSINYPKITLTATSEETVDQATIAEAVVNYWWRHHKIQPEIRRAVKDSLVYGHGWIKVGYRYQEKEAPIPTENLSVGHAMLANELDQFAQENPHLAADLPTDEDIASFMQKTETVVLEDRPFVERVSPFDMYVDPEATYYHDSDNTDAAWVAQRVIRPVEEARKDTRYRQSVRKSLQADGEVTWKLEKSKWNVDEEGGRVALWEFYDLRRKTVAVFAESGDDFLVDPEPMPYTFGCPFVYVPDYEVPDQFYAIGELEALEPLQQELNETRSSMIRARKNDIRKYMARRNALGPQGVDALRSDKDNTVILVDDETPFTDVIGIVPTNNTDAQLYQHSETVLNDFDRVSGVTEYMRGETSDIRRTATEASLIQDAANSRAADKLARVENAVASVARCLVQLAQSYMTGEQTARITGSDGTHKWFKFKRTDIEGEFDFTVEAGSMQPLNETFRRQQAIQLGQTMSPFVDAGIVDPRALVTKILQDGFGIKNPEKFILPPPKDQNQPPAEKLIETINYKDAPPDIQRQMEAEAGFQPSSYGMTPHDGGGGAATRAGQQGSAPPDALATQNNGGGALGPGA